MWCSRGRNSKNYGKIVFAVFAQRRHCRKNGQRVKGKRTGEVRNNNVSSLV